MGGREWESNLGIVGGGEERRFCSLHQHYDPRGTEITYRRAIVFTTATYGFGVERARVSKRQQTIENISTQDGERELVKVNEMRTL